MIATGFVAVPEDDGLRMGRVVEIKADEARTRS